MLKQLRHTPFAFILTAASGAGKGTIGAALMHTFSQLHLSISATTRPKRPGEQDAVHYHFLSQEEFKKNIADNAFFEHAEVFGNYYGTLKSTVSDAFDRGEDVLFDIDWQGAKQIKDQLKERAVIIHILPPSYEILRQRLIDRGQDTAEVIQHRMDKAKSEISHWENCDYVVVNHDLEEAIREVKAIFLAETRRHCRLNMTAQINQEFDLQ